MTARQPLRLTPEQYQLLTAPLAPQRVGKNPKGFSHLEAWDVRRWLIRIFGFGGYDIENTAHLVKEIESPPGSIKYSNGGTNNKTVWTVVYRADTRLTVRDQAGGYVVLEDGACGDATNQPSCGDAHDNALKTALSQALKRCCVNLGDQFGLSLYNDGRTQPVVLRSVVAPDMPADDGPGVGLSPADDGPVLPEPGTAPPADEHQADEHTAAPAEPAQPAQPSATAIRDWALVSDRTADGIRRAAAKLAAEHPTVAAAEVVNEHGDPEPLGALLARRVRELTPAPTPDEERRRRRMHALYNELGVRDREQRLTVASMAVGRDIASTNDLVFPSEVETVITVLETRQRQQHRQPQGAAA